MKPHHTAFLHQLFRKALPGLLLLATVACQSGSGESTKPISALKKHEAREGVHTLYGMIIRKEPAPRSVEAYQGAEFYLHDPHFHNSGLPFSDDRIVLQPSENVSREQLLKFNHVFVTITVEKAPGSLPHPDSSYPTNPDGSPILQGTGWKVLQILP
ncbi:MAG: hypothetical protein RH862_17730 [Leptospiraceae bacterium]